VKAGRRWGRREDRFWSQLPQAESSCQSRISSLSTALHCSHSRRAVARATRARCTASVAYLQLATEGHTAYQSKEIQALKINPPKNKCVPKNIVL